jgi:threonyl-tRNA synthetase
MTPPELELELPDGTRMQVPLGTTPLEVATRIGPGLGRAALAAELDGQMLDLRAPIERGGSFRVFTARDAEAGDVIRHSAEHVMADAVKRLWPATQIDVGRRDHAEKFQYDFDIPVRVGADELAQIEAEMGRIIAEDQPFEREVVSREEARERLAAMGEQLKISRLDDIPEGQDITLFRHGNFVDLCRGPHLQRTGQIGAYKLTEVAGSYWRGDESNPMLQRVYGIAFRDDAELAGHFERLEQARKRDHRRVGAELGLFFFHEWAQGSPFYLPKGLALFQGLVGYIQDLYRKYGYQEVMCPQIFDAELFKISGHYENFREDMFRIQSGEDEELFVKPMNCPGHCLLFRSTKRSYRELPMRLAEFSRLHRDERSGTLTGMTRVRSMSQDDAHIYCEPEQVADEVHRFFEMTEEVYRALGLSGVEVSVSTRPESGTIGEPEDWERAELLLIEAVRGAGYECGIKAGEAAFYAPKVEFDFRDVLGRGWTLATLQIDMAMPGRFGLRYIGRDGAEHQPAMLHRTVLGSLERFIGIYIEHTGGDFPLWLAPQQVAVLPVAEPHAAYANKVAHALASDGIRASADDRNETLGYRIRDAETQKIPIIAVVGKREEGDGTVSVRRRHHKEQTSENVDDFRSRMREEVRTRGIS